MACRRELGFTVQGRDGGLLVALAATWGLSFVFIRIASPALGPFLLVELRVGIAAIVLGGIVLVRGWRPTDVPELRTRGRAYLTVAVVNAVIPFCLISAAELVLPASVASIVNATVPLFTAVMAATWIADPLTVSRTVGLVLGFGGVVLLVGGGTLPRTLPDVLGVAASLAGAVSYAGGAIYARRTFASTSPVALAFGQEIVAALVILPLAFGTLPQATWTVPVVVSTLGLAVFSTALGYLVYFDLLRRIGPTRSTSVTFLVPVFGVAWSWLLLGERVGPSLVLGLVVILLGVGLVTGVVGGSKPSSGGTAR